MKPLALVLPVTMALGACQGTDPTMAGAVGGAAVGAVVDEDEPIRGAVIGTAAGAALGSLIGRADTPGDCVYRDQYGNRYIAPC